MVQMTLLLLLSSTTIALASFGPNVRIDHQYLPNHGCHRCAIAIGPGAPSSQPLYVAFQDDSTRGPTIVRSDIVFQKSTDAGRTWLPTDLLIRRGAPGTESPDITTDSDGNVYIVYENWYRDTAGAYDHQVLCTRSTDGGVTWSSPARVMDTSTAVGSARIVADSAGNLFCAWNDWRTGSGHIWSSVSTDRGVTWSRNVRVCDDTTNRNCFQPDVCVQPGTNHYFVAAEVPRPGGPSSCYLYRSTDMGRSFQSGVLVNTSGGFAGSPHVVADAQHVVCDYTGKYCKTEARTWYTQPDTWSVPCPMCTSNANGLQLAISADGRVHTALLPSYEDTYYALSSDHGVSWSDPERANSDTITPTLDPDIAADSAGHVYIVWRKGSVQHGEIWFATNNPLAIEEETSNVELRAPNNGPTIVRGVLFLAERPSSSASTSSLFDTGGREVLDLSPGANDVSKLAPGVYFVRAVSRELSAVSCQKVVVTR